MQQINISGALKKRCAFCVHWYDPTNSAICPVNPVLGLWEVEREKCSHCAILNVRRAAWMSCHQFLFKL